MSTDYADFRRLRLSRFAHPAYFRVSLQITRIHNQRNPHRHLWRNLRTVITRLLLRADTENEKG
jgi:hypothetical protein